MAPEAPNGDAQPTSKFNADYFRTVPGILKVIELILGVICVATSSSSFFYFVAIVSFVKSLLWSLVYLFRIKENLNIPLDWLTTELLNTGIITIFYVIGVIVQLTSLFNIVAVFFGLCNMLVYAGATYLLYQDHKNRGTPASVGTFVVA